MAAPNKVKKKVRRSILGTRIFYNCPKCGQVLEFRKKMHQNLCMRCGQSLDWGDYDAMQAVWIRARDREEAGYWAEQYLFIGGSTYGIDIGKWLKEKRTYPALLYFPFPDGKAYGRFMRKAANEAEIVKNFNQEEKT